jgi:superfamily I DNA/RNA helicase
MAGYYFNLPAITQLTISQQSALNETRPIALSGGPGTGKSVVSLWRHINNYENGKQSLLLTYTTTLKQYLRACCRGRNNNAGQNVGTTYRERPSRQWDEIILDEAQDMEKEYYEDIKQYGNISYGADDSQILYPNHSTKQSELRSIFPTNVQCVLDKNFRSTQRIMKFAKQAFFNAVIPQRTIDDLSKNIGELPVLLISNGDNFERTNTKQNEAIERIINSFRSEIHNIAILVPWKSDVNIFEEVLNEQGVDFSVYYDDRGRFPKGCEDISNVHLTTFKSAKGLEFDTVIIPNFHKYNEICGRFNTDWNDFYVACTRARSNLYLISNCDFPNLNSVTDKQVL